MLMLRLRVLLIVACLLLFSGSALATTTVQISDQGGGHIGFCKDNNLRSGAGADNNHGVTNALSMGRFNSLTSTFRSILRFQTSLIPMGSRVISASLVLEQSSAVGTGDTVDLRGIRPLNNAWVEGTKDGATEVGSSCWNDLEYQNQTEWDGSPGLSTSGTDYTAFILAPNVDCSGGAGTRTWTFNAAGRTWLQGQIVIGTDADVRMAGVNEAGDNWAIFHSSEAVVAANRPYLEVEYIAGSQVIAVEF